MSTKISQKLNEQMRLFCRNLIETPWDQTGAAIRAGYSAKTAYTQASRLLKNVQVREELTRLRGPLEERVVATKARVLEELTHIAFLDPSSMFNEEGALLPVREMPAHIRRAIASIEVVENAGGAMITVPKPGAKRDPTAPPPLVHVPMYTKKIKMVGKDRALEMLGRHFKMFTDKVHIDNIDQLADRLARARARARAA